MLGRTGTTTKMAGDVPVSGDYDGDGKTDIGVWRPSSGIWYILSSADPGTYTATAWGMNGDEAISAPPQEE